MRNLMRTCVRYSTIVPLSTLHDVSSTSIASIPRIVLDASASACSAASLQDSADTPTRSMVLITATYAPLRFVDRTRATLGILTGRGYDHAVCELVVPCLAL